MFPGRPRRPFPPHRPMPPRRLPYGGSQSPTSNLMSMFKTSEGKMDFEKITTTAQQINKLYQEFSPMISQFLKK
ncbi:MAG TPA: YppG family protein [Bacillota bacterium]|nr:YppG family protein [Bacillota bacterium]